MFVVQDWLAAVTSEMSAADANEDRRNRAAMLWGFSRFHALLRDCGTWLSDAEVASLKQARNALLRCYNLLALRAARDGLHRFPMKPKHHMIDHAVRFAELTRLNPSAHWCFAEEDNVGFMSKVLAGCHDRSMETRALERWAMQFFADL